MTLISGSAMVALPPSGASHDLSEEAQHGLMAVIIVILVVILWRSRG